MGFDSSYADDLQREELQQLIMDAGLVEDIPMALIRELCGRNVIDCTRYHEAWAKLCDEYNDLAAVAEERMEAIG